MAHASLVIPCFDEADRLDDDGFTRALDEFPELHLLFVDDGSADRTFEIVSGLAARRPDRVSALRLARNGGKAEAVRAGLNRALESNPSFAGYFDADLAIPLDHFGSFRRIFAERAHTRAVLGARVQLLGRKIERGRVRHLVGRTLATIVAQVLDMKIYDSQCGAKLFRVDDNLREALKDPFESGWMFDVELLARLRDRYRAEGLDASQVIYEFPLRECHDIAGSKVRWRDGIAALRSLSVIRRKYPPSASTP